MKIRNKLYRGASIALLSMMLLHTTAVQAEANVSPNVFLDGLPLSFQTSPIIEEGFSLVPMRALFEAEGATITWNENTRTVTAVKDDTTVTYQIGDTFAYKNKERLELPIPGKIIDGFTMMPLRFISESLGNLVKWHDYSRSITISSVHDYESTILYGVNLRDTPEKDNDTHVLRMLPKTEKIHVIREVNSDWLEVQAQDGTIGFISSAPMYSDYTNTSIALKQADAIITFGSKFLGTPYEFGAASGQTNTFDCSSFVQYVFDKVLSKNLPRVSYDQAQQGKEVGINDLRKGDLLFFTARGLDIGHVGIYSGNGRILQTYSKEDGVHFTAFDEKWKKRFVKARRLF